MIKGKKTIFDEVREEMDARDPTQRRIRVAITDGERALQRLVTAKLGEAVVVLDLFHVMEKVWAVGGCLHPAGSVELTNWVKAKLLKILHGRVELVVRGIRQSATKRNLQGGKLKAITSACNYLHSNRDRMRYNEYLDLGFPIGSGVIEGACKNLVRDRMERTGMRWTKEMAEAMLKLRATYRNGDFDEYWRFHKRCEQRRLYERVTWAAAA